MSKIDILHKTCLFLVKRLGDFYMAEKMDRRVRKTKAQLREGLARLMQKKSIKEISVKELVDEVDINRSTFYLHYTDIYQMLHKIEEEAMQNITEVMQNHPIDQVTRIPYCHLLSSSFPSWIKTVICAWRFLDHTVIWHL